MLGVLSVVGGGCLSTFWSMVGRLKIKVWLVMIANALANMDLYLVVRW